MASSGLTIDTPIPSGSWSLYFHAHDNPKWNLASFTLVGQVKTWREFWSLIEGLRTEAIADGMFFFMRDPIPPLWENHQNIRGGSYSIRVQRKDAGETYVSYVIATMLGTLTKDRASASADRSAQPATPAADGAANTVNGISISPKKGFNILKMWNTDAARFNKPTDIHILTKEIRPEDILYTPFVEKKM